MRKTAGAADGVGALSFMAVPENINGRSIARFGTFELDRDAGELRRDGLKVRVQDQPMRLLEVLLEQPGKVIAREELQQRLWPADTFVEFDHALNTAVNKLRDALGDSADDPRYLATVPRRGYRFIAPVEEIGSTNGQLGASEGEQGERTVISWRTAGAAVGILAVLVAVYYAGRMSHDTTEKAQVPHRRFTVLHDFPGAIPVISPNGERIAFMPASVMHDSEHPIRIQHLGKATPRPIPETEGAYFGFWSPDSRLLGYFAAGELRVIDTDGGGPRTVCKILGPSYGGAWNPNGQTIVFSAGLGETKLFEVPAQGGTPRAFDLENPENLSGYAFPVFVASQSSPSFLLVQTGTPTSRELGIVELPAREVHRLGRGGPPIGYSDRHILYQEYWPVGDVFALPYSLARSEPTGDPFVVAEQASNVSVAGDGTIVYTPSADLRWQLAWLNRSGERLGYVGEPFDRGLIYPSVSPDERYIVFEAGKPPRDLWLVDTVRSITSLFTTNPAHDTVGIWSRTGREVYFQSMRDGNRDVFLKGLGSGKEPVKIVDRETDVHGNDESPDGSVFLYGVGSPKGDVDLWFAKRRKDGSGYEYFPFLQTPSNEGLGRFSRDGRWVAYRSDESGREEIYIRQFPGGGEVRQVSRHGGTQVRWSRDGAEIFYVEGQTLMSVPVSGSDELVVGKPNELFSHPQLFSHWSWPTYDVSADGQKFLLVETFNPSGSKTHIIQNWFAEFRDRQ